MSLKDEFRRCIAAFLLAGAAKITPEGDTLTHQALSLAARSMVKDDELRGVKLRELKPSE